MEAKIKRLAQYDGTMECVVEEKKKRNYTKNNGIKQQHTRTLYNSNEFFFSFLSRHNSKLSN